MKILQEIFMAVATIMFMNLVVLWDNNLLSKTPKWCLSIMITVGIYSIVASVRYTYMARQEKINTEEG